MRAVFSNLYSAALRFLLVVYLGATCAVAADARYANAEYGFSVQLPKAVPPVESQPPAPQHGVALDLPSGGRIWIDGSFDAGLQGSAKAVMKQLLEEEGGSMTNPLQPRKVANLEAVSASYTKAQIVSTRVVAYRPRVQAIAVVYTFGLDTTPMNQSEDNEIFAKIVRSFVVTPLPE